MAIKQSDSKFDLTDVTKGQVGLGNVDNTSDVNKPISDATKVYVDKVRLATGTDDQNRFDKILWSSNKLDIIRNDDNKVITIRYENDIADTGPYFRDTLSYREDLKLIEVKHWYNTSDLVTESGKTTLTYTGSELATVVYTE